MRSIQFTGSCQSAYHYVAACTVKWMNDKLQTFSKTLVLMEKQAGSCSKRRSTLANWIIRKKLRNYWNSIFFGLSEIQKKNQELSRFHLFDAKGNVKGVRDMEIVWLSGGGMFSFCGGESHRIIMSMVSFPGRPWWGKKMKYRIQKLILSWPGTVEWSKESIIYWSAAESSHGGKYELKYSSLYGGLILKMDIMIRLRVKCWGTQSELSDNQSDSISYYPEDCEQVLQGGENIKSIWHRLFLTKKNSRHSGSILDTVMTQDTQFQKFLTLKGNGGTGKVWAVSLIQHVVGITNMSSISLQDFK